ncbi:non-ribosomal peptide synthetase [Brevibacillus antibioticus]|uniref:non-ribosomal peptide synthetase n=1 Tax=Brevibacillus antibioticus TaxID=2570228 RepID=UPI001390190C|nr:non-ribosomal peptide synthetase [Brevibacillus antibioticus]
MDSGLKVQKIYNLTPMQEGMLYHSLLSQDSHMYFEQATLTITGELDLELLEQSVNLLISRHEVLRTNFVHEKLKKPQQVVFQERPIKLHVEDISSLSKVEEIGYLKQFIQQDKQKGFDLLRDPLLRFSVIKVAPKQYKLIRSYHHIIMDGWSQSVFTQELFSIYSQMKRNTPLHLSPVQPFQVYIDWINKQNKKEAYKHWQRYLQSYEETVTLPIYGTPRKVDTYIRSETCFDFSEDIQYKLSNLAKQHRTTLSTVMHMLWGLLLQKYNHVNDVVFGSVVSARPPQVEGIERMVGLFINTVPFRVKSEPDLTVSALLRRVSAESLASRAYEYVSLAEIQSQSVLKQDLLNHIVVFENYPRSKPAQADVEAGPGIEISDVEISEQTNYDLNVIIESEPKLAVQFNYNANVFDAAMIQKAGEHLQVIASAITENPDIRIQDLEILTLEEKHIILHAFNDTAVPYDSDKPVYRWIEEQAKKTPDQTAIVFGNESLTYRQVNEKANQLARLLRRQDVQADSIVVQISDRSFEMIIGLLAIWKAGGAYLPIDPFYPMDRIRYMMEDSGATILLTADPQGLGTHHFHGTIIDLRDPDLACEESTDLEQCASTENLAYLLYTSGSTGKPKGVMVNHQSVSNLLRALIDHIDFRSGKRIVSVTTPAFDIFVVETFIALALGLTVVVASDEELQDPELLCERLVRSQVQMIQTTPSRMQLLFNHSDFSDRSLHVTDIMIAGEAFPETLLSQLATYVPKASIYNIYGPTETTVYATLHPLTIDQPITIGKPLANMKVYIMDADNNLMPIGIAGELCIAGDGLARGYLNRSELTAEKFTQNRFGELIYRTGDLARWLPNGEIDYLGRMDSQEKIRGFRVELNEIKHCLNQHPLIQDAVVTIRNDSPSEKTIIGYYIGEQDIDVSELIEHLQKTLPYYMIPAYFVRVDEWPLTPSGKIDRNQLPEVEGSRSFSTGEFVAPTTQLELELSAIWRGVLELETISVHDNFFQVGGNSIKVVWMHSQINTKFPGRVRITDLFAYPTIAKLSAFIEEGMSDTLVLQPQMFPQRLLMQNGEASEDMELHVMLPLEVSAILHDTAEQASVSLEDVCLGTYAYFLSEITESLQVSLYTTALQSSQIIPLHIGMDSIDDLSTLFTQISHGRAAQSASGRTQSIEAPPTKEGLYLLFYSDAFPPSVGVDPFDLRMIIKPQTDRMQIVFEYRSSRVESNTVKEMLQSYAQFLSNLASHSVSQ